MTKEEKIVYLFVARDKIIVADCKATDFPDEIIVTKVAKDKLQQLPSSKDTFSGNKDGYTFNYLIRGRFIYCVVTTQSTGPYVAIDCLHRIKNDFNKKYPGGIALNEDAESLKTHFGPNLRKNMNHYSQDSVVSEAQADAVINILMDNTQEVLERAATFNGLVKDNKEKENHPQYKLWYQEKTTKFKTVRLGGTIVLALSVVFCFCPWFNCDC